MTGGEIIEIDGNNYIFLGLSKKIFQYKVRMAMHNGYFCMSHYIDEIRQDAINDVLYASAVLFSINDNLELDAASEQVSYLYFDLFSIDVKKKIEDIDGYLDAWKLKMRMLNNEELEIPELLTIEEALQIVKQNEQDEDYIKLREKRLKNFLMYFMEIYKDTEYYDKIKEYSKQFPEVEREDCVNLHVYRKDEMLFFSKLKFGLYAAVDRNDLRECAIALAKKDKSFHMDDTFEKVFGD